MRYTATGYVYQEAAATFDGSPHAAGKSPTNIASLAYTADGKGYWEIRADGTVYAYGDASTITASVASSISIV